MAFTLSPGVAVQEIDLTTIVPQVSTTTGAFAGFFNWGSVNKPYLIDSESTMSTTLQPPDSNTAVFYWSAANFLDYGNSLYLVRANSTGLFSATANTLEQIMLPNKDVYFYNYYNSGSNGLFGPWIARYPGKLGNNILVSVCPSAQAYSSNLTVSQSITVTANVGSSNILTSAPVTTFVTVGDTIAVGQAAGVSNGYITVTGISSNGNVITTSSGVVKSNGSSLDITHKWQYAALFPGAPGTSSSVLQNGGANDEMHIIILDSNGAFYGSSTQNYVLEKYTYVSKASDAKNNDSSTNYYKDIIFNQSKFIYLADHLDHFTPNNGFNNILNGTSSNPFTTSGTTWGTPSSGGTNYTNIKQAITTKLVGGSDITTPYNVQGFTGGLGGISDPNDAGLIQGYSYFQDSDQYNISLVPTGPASVTVQQYIIDSICGTRLDCVSFHSPRYNDVVNNSGSEATTIVNNYLVDLGRSTSYAVVDNGWKYQFDKYNNNYRYIPLNSDIAGLCVNTDTVRAPWWSPAGFNRGAIKNVVKLAWNPGNSTANPYRDLLYMNGVNPVVTMKGQGTVLFGDKTLQAKPSAFDRINVRRLFIVLEKSIATAAKYSLFEFNDNFTRTAFINMVTPFLTQIQGGRGITAFKVVCDTTNNPGSVIDANQFVGDIYIKPARSINFINLRFVAVGTSVDFSEIVGTF